MNTCTLCGCSGLQFSISFTDRENKAISLAICPQCQALIPHYKNISISNSVEHQARAHEEQWKNSTKDELIKTLMEVSDLVKDLKNIIGPPSKEDIVIEIGAGRGSLLQALLDAGYPAYGCEPAAGLVQLAKENYGLTSNFLYEMDAENFLQNVVPKLPGLPHVFLLWHVLEHMENPMQLLRKLYSLLSDQGCLIFQLPLLNQKMIYPEHYFLVSHETINFIANEIGFKIEGIEYDLDNLFVTAFFRKNISCSQKKSISFHEDKSTPPPLVQAILLRDQFAEKLRNLLAERVNTIEHMTTIIRDRDDTILAQTQLIDERVSGMNLMETLIRDRDETIFAQTQLIDERVLGMNLMETLIRDRDEIIIAQTKLIDERVLGMNFMEAIICEQEKKIAMQIKFIDEQISDMSAMKKIVIAIEQKNNDLEEKIKLKELKISNIYLNKFLKILKISKLINIKDD